MHDPSPIRPGALFAFDLGDGRWGGGQVIGLEPHPSGLVVLISMCGALWDCEIDAFTVGNTPKALESLPVPPARLCAVHWLGEGVISEDSEAAAMQWRTPPPEARPVADAPLSAFLSALVDEG